MDICRVAGCGASGHQDGPAAAARFSWPCGIALDREQGVVVTDLNNFCLRRISPAGQVTTVAGGRKGFADGMGSAAAFSSLEGLAIDRQGNAIVADAGNHCVRRVTPAGAVTTIAGCGVRGHADGPGRLAQFNSPQGIVLHPNGDIFVSDYNDHRIRCIRPDGRVSTLAGTGRAGYADAKAPLAEFNGPYGMALDSDLNLLVVDSMNRCIRKIFPDGHVTTLAGHPDHGELFSFPTYIAVDGDGNAVVAEYRSGAVHIVTPAGEHVRVPLLRRRAGLFPHTDGDVGRLTGLALDREGCLIVASAQDHSVYRLDLHLAPPPLPPPESPSSPSSPLSARLARLLVDDPYADTTFHVAGQEVRVHRCLLAPRSAYFQALFAGPFGDSLSGCIEVEDTSVSAFLAFVRFLYTDELEFDEDFIGVMKLCHQYQVEDGYQKCLQYINANLEPSTAVPWLVECHHYHLEEPSAALLQYVVRRLGRIRDTAAHTLEALKAAPELMLAILHGAPRP